MRYSTHINSAGVAAFLAIAFLIGGVPSASAQVFLAKDANPEFRVGPLFVNHAMPRDPGGVVQVNLSWSLTSPSGRTPPVNDDLYLLWPAEIARPTADGTAEPELARYVESRGLQVLSSGRLALRSRDRSHIGTTNLGDPLPVAASYVTFIRAGAPQLGVGSYVKIPWTPKMNDPLSVMTLPLPVKGLIGIKPASWFEEIFWGRRYIATASFGDVGQVALSLFPIYFEKRDHVVHLARDYCIMIMNFPDSDHLRIDEITPSNASRRGSRVRAGVESVTLMLSGGDGVASQVMRVQFNYFNGIIAWRPIVISLILLALGNVMGTVMLGKSIKDIVRKRFALGAPGARKHGVIAGDALRGIEPGRSTQADVLRLCGPPQEERQRLGGRHRTLVYRGSVLNTHPRFVLGWFSTIKYREVEHHELVVEIEDDRVRDVEWRVGRSRAD
jgi:hypothetical protein